MKIEEMKKIAGEAVKIALDEGAETAEARVTADDLFNVTVRNGKTENLSESGSNSIGITLSRDKRKSSATSSDLSQSGTRQLIREAIELSMVMDRDEYFGLPEEDEIGMSETGLEIFDPESVTIPAERKRSIALELERVAKGSDSRIISDGASFSSGVYSSSYANSLGF